MRGLAAWNCYDQGKGRRRGFCLGKGGSCLYLGGRVLRWERERGAIAQEKVAPGQKFWDGGGKEYERDGFIGRRGRREACTWLNRGGWGVVLAYGGKKGAGRESEL